MSPERTLTVLVADDSPVARRLLVQILEGDPRLRVVAEAQNGDEAVDLATRHRPDVIVMDIVMPSMDGLEATRRIMEVLPVPIVLVSATHDATDLSRSFQALKAGALTVLAKPSGPRSSTFNAEAAGLATAVKLMADVKVVRRRPAAGNGSGGATGAAPARARAHGRAVELIAIAASTGGPAALATIVAALPRATPVPIVIVQHITPGFQQGLAEWLDSVSALSVRVARDRDPLRAGEVLVAPPEAHLGVTSGGRIVLSAKPPIGGHQPSATHMFRSVARAYGSAAVGAILTGMGQDGVAGLRELHEAGGVVLAQDEATSVVYGMPHKAVALGIVDHILPIDEMAPALITQWNGRKR